jgi:hypothetical protein
MNRWRVGEDRGSKEKDRCPLTTLKTAAPTVMTVVRTEDSGGISEGTLVRK